jgi:hypothetical protein
MVPRATLIAVLIGVEVALVVAMAGAVRGRSPSTWFGFSHDSAGASSAAAVAQSWTFPAGGAPSVTIDIGLADLTIETRPGAQQIAVGVAPGVQFGPSGAISARQDGGTVRITAPDTSGWHFFQADDRNVHVTVPPETRIVVESAGDIVAGGLRAAASFAGEGFVKINDFQGDLSATSSNGHIEITDASCSALHVDSSNGRVVLRRVTARQIVATSSNGRIEATALDARDGSVSSSNGRVSLDFAPGADTTVTAEASNGSVRVSGLDAAAPAQAVSGGDDEDDDDSGGPSAKTVRIGAGGGRLDVHASNGNIDLMRES